MHFKDCDVFHMQTSNCEYTTRPFKIRLNDNQEIDYHKTFKNARLMHDMHGSIIKGKSMRDFLVLIFWHENSIELHAKLHSLILVDVKESK